MAVIHHTTLSPSKVELLHAWLPGRAWFRGGDILDLVRAGGFRLDDPAGEVGMEFYLVTDTGTGTTYHVPMAYRGAPLDGADDALIGTTEHGVLGRRWVYDGARDPVLAEQALELLAGRAQAQDQDVSSAPAAPVYLVPAEVGTPISLRINRIPVEDGEPDGRRGLVGCSWRTPEGGVRRGILLEAVAVPGRT
ncbi:1,4-alpha-glucan branching protein [Nocardia sp. NEAU-G5]|uniref:1,4-alpha-glucan branching protein n=1 Tax=Nocardia albiluteola TaxID=2842303 RepID=A0ABS6B4C9_9NOCA|nr:1,4-alpha-glucan branching protein [Nocardia albiluteola]MBU3064576.1 1,4-alpha-glucan branching protein [Nocardia albiluteola]